MLHLHNILPEIDGKVKIIELGKNRFLALWSKGFSILCNAMITEHGDKPSLAKFNHSPEHKSKPSNTDREIW